MRWSASSAVGLRPKAMGVTLRRSFDGRLLGQSWETPLVEVPEGPITEATVQQMIDRFHDEYERRYGNRFPVVPVQGVTYRVELVVPVDKVSYDRLNRARAARSSPPIRGRRGR